MAEVERKYRLRKNRDFQRVYREGDSWVHPLLVLYALPNGLEHSRFGFSVGHRIGKAVTRNRVKRLLREATRLRLPLIAQGWDLVFIARQPLSDAAFHQVDGAIEELLRRAHLLEAPILDNEGKQ